MKKYLAITLVAALAVAAIISLGPYLSKADTSINNITRPGGIFYAPTYNWHGLMATGNAGTGSQTVIIGPSIVSLPDGRQMAPFGPAVNQLTPVIFDMGANSETVTPTAVSVTTCPTTGDFSSTAQCVSFTGSFSNTHGAHTGTASGTAGINEAVADAGANGGGSVYWEVDCGIITLNTGGATTTATGPCANIPKTFTNLGVSAFVTTTITTSASYSIGISGATTAFATSCTALTAATTCSQFVAAPGKTSQGAGFSALLITANAAAGAGAVHVKVWGYIGAQGLS